MFHLNVKINDLTIFNKLQMTLKTDPIFLDAKTK